jgi:hypothetical protein
MAYPVDNFTDARPPGEPWHRFEHADPVHGYASCFLSDELARLPVRAVTRVRDNKSDPNIETGTYGLFSTCEEKMRSGIVRNSPKYIFFVTKPRRSSRELTGFYELGWWAPGSFHSRSRDYALAARRIRLIEPVRLDRLPRALATVLAGRWRLNKRLDAECTRALAEFVASRPDLTAAYLEELDRVERINLFHSGYRYPTWKREQPFSWTDARTYLTPGAELAKGEAIANASPTGWWRCAHCEQASRNDRLLRACPDCHRQGTLRPIIDQTEIT